MVAVSLGVGGHSQWVTGTGQALGVGGRVSPAQTHWCWGVLCRDSGFPGGGQAGVGAYEIVWALRHMREVQAVPSASPSMQS